MIKDREKLTRHLERWADACQEYSDLFCPKFVAGWAVECGKPDPLTHYGKWTTPIGARRIIKANGGRVLEAVTKSLGPYKPISELGWGAIVCTDNPPFDALGILDGSRVICLSSHGGFRHASRAQFVSGWDL